MEESKPALDPGGRDDVATAAATTEDLVISGISCRLPKSENMAEFCKNLMEGEDMVTEDNLRWTPGTIWEFWNFDFCHFFCDQYS